jgi:hypothetical protein
MSALSLHSSLAIAAFSIAIGSAVLARGSSAPSSPVAEVAAPATIDPFTLARQLADGQPDEVVISLDEPKHSLRFAQPSTLFGSTDEALIEGAPRARHIVLVGFDVVRVDRLARRLRSSGRDVRVLAGGLDSWDKAMDQDPPSPAPGDNAIAWQTYRDHVALRHSFGDAQPAAASPILAPVAPVGGAGAGVPKKREGC